MYATQIPKSKFIPFNKLKNDQKLNSLCVILPHCLSRGV